MWHKKDIKFNYSDSKACEIMEQEYSEVKTIQDSIEKVFNWFNWASILKRSNDSVVQNHGEAFEQGARRLYQELTGRTYQSKIVIPNY